MGYSARYHAASLAAVFLALAIGILIGVGFGDRVVSGTQRNLEKSLVSDLDEARGAAEELRAETRRRREFEHLVYPALVGDRLSGQRVALIGLGGGLPGAVVRDVREALAPSGGRLAEVAVLRAPLDLDGLAEALGGTRFAGLERERRALDDFGETAGRQLVRGGRALRRARGRLFSRASGSPGGIDGVVLVRDRPERLEPAERSALDRFERALLRGVDRAGATMVGVERSDGERSAIPFFDDRDVSTVDSIDLVSGRVALIFALAGARGAFGVKGSADQLLPEPLVP